MPRRTTQVEIIVFKIINDEILFLLLKRNEQKGGFWQAVTGGVESDESLIQAVNRELREETGITKYLRIIDNVYYFEFDTDDYGRLKEYVFGIQVGVDKKIKISSEHTEMRWCSLDEALELLKYDNNKTAFKKLSYLLMSTFEKKYNIKETDKVKDLHRSRRMFCIYNNKLRIAEENTPDSHAAWFIKEKWMTEEDDSLMDEISRGMVKDDGDVYFYVGYNFEINNRIESAFFKHLSELADKLKLNPEAQIFGGLIKSEPGTVWPPIRKYGKIKKFIKS